MKKRLSLFVSALLVLGLFAACGGTASTPVSSATPGPSSAAAPAEKLEVVATIFPPFDFVREIAGSNVNLTQLLPPGAESHSYEPTPQDIITIQNCDVFIYNGGDSDAWITDILASMDTSGKTVLSMMDMVEVKEEEIVEGMEDDHGHDHGEEEFDAADVKDRPMSDFAGAWISGIPLIEDGSLDRYIENSAAENDVTPAERREALLANWASDYDNITIDGSTLAIGDTKAEYSYQGYEIVESDHGTSVWYEFQIAAPDDALPAYLMFNDHGYGQEPAEEGHRHEEGEKGHDEEHEEIAHIHMKYGDEGFDALLAKEDWAPFYFDSTHTGAEIGEFMGGHEEAAELDEHVWTAPQNAKRIVQAISDALCGLDEGNAATYEQNTAAYLQKLDELDAAFAKAVESGSRRTIVFGDRFPLRYFADAYGLDYYAAFPGCSTETEASAATVAFLIDEVKAENIPVVFHIELSNEKMADTICADTGAQKRLFHSCHNVTQADLDAGASYLSLMTRNVDVLKEALR